MGSVKTLFMRRLFASDIASAAVDFCKCAKGAGACILLWLRKPQNRLHTPLCHCGQDSHTQHAAAPSSWRRRIDPGLAEAKGFLMALGFKGERIRDSFSFRSAVYRLPRGLVSKGKHAMKS